MGYRSDVKMAIQAEHGVIAALLTSWRMKSLPGYTDARTSMQIVTDDQRDTLFLDCDSIKWYDDFEEIIAWTTLWDIADAMQVEGVDIDGAFIRVGENDDDVESKVIGDGHDLICYHRSSSFEFGTHGNQTLDEAFSVEGA